LYADQSFYLRHLGAKLSAEHSGSRTNSNERYSHAHCYDTAGFLHLAADFSANLSYTSGKRAKGCGRFNGRRLYHASELCYPATGRSYSR
jgi:hypothetical protein